MISQNTSNRDRETQNAAKNELLSGSPKENLVFTDEELKWDYVHTLGRETI